MKRFEWALLIGLVVSIAVSMWGFAADCAALREEVLRVHILANSDSAADQRLKLQVRDALLAQSAALFGGAETLPEAEAALARQLDEVEKIANAALAAAGSSDTARAELVNMYFTTRHYEGEEYSQAFSMPAGRYDAIRVTIGAGQGRNWWCVAYPPMCIDAAKPEAGADVEARILALQETVVYRPKLAVVEWYEELKEKRSAGENA